MDASRSRRAFTLIEVLVVVAIIAILIAILLPSLSGAREHARFVACSANLRSVGQLVQIYSEQNDGRIPRGPSHTIDQPLGAQGLRYKLTNTAIATSQLWMGYDFLDPQGIRRRAQYVGLGLLTRQPGRKGNEFLFCPGDDFDHLNEDGDAMGQLGRDAVGSYLFRQMDMLPREIQLQGKIDDMRETDCAFLRDRASGQPLRYNLGVEALALDHNSQGDDEFAAGNHRGQWINVVYRDGSVAAFDNEPQRTLDGRLVPWGTIGAEPFEHFPDDDGWKIQSEMDRIFIAADFSRNDQPWLAPLPFNSVGSAGGGGGS